MVLLAAVGFSNADIAAELGVKPHTVGRWRNRFAENRLKGIEKDQPRGGRLPRERERIQSEIIRKTTQELPANATHWTTRTPRYGIAMAALSDRSEWPDPDSLGDLSGHAGR
jgi:transposase